jgi:hypothetical protein
MTRFSLNAFLLLTLAILAAPRVAHAAESYDNCTGFIASLPAVISTQGTWCFNKDLTTAITSGFAITINTNNVTLDCNYFKLGGLAAGVGTQTSGIFAQNRLNATVRHCNIRGFATGVDLAGATGGGHVVEDNRFDGNTFIGVTVEGDGSVVRRNLVFDTGGTPLTANVFGITSKYSVDILDNTVSGVTANSGFDGDAIGIYTTSNPDGSITGNRLRGLLRAGTGFAAGIDNALSGRITITGNHAIGAGGSFVGIRCTDASGSAKDNVMNGFTTGLATCTDSGGNAIIP